MKTDETADRTTADLTPEIADLYAGPLDTFVARRDAWAKVLRAGGQRDGAAVIKALRKPSRIAWALNRATAGPSIMDTLLDGLAAARDAHAGGRELRDALRTVRVAVEAFADAALEQAAAASITLDRGELVNAVMAVIGDAEAFQLLRAGRLNEVPAAGGLGWLETLPPGIGRERRPAVAPPAPAAPANATVVPIAAAALRRAEEKLAQAKERAAAAERALRDAEAKLEQATGRLEQAEARLRLAREEVAAREHDRTRARDAAEAARTELQEAERAIERARTGAQDR